ncbi:MAG TPA: acyl-CoA dehydrogenase [Rhizobium sp.]|nr:acyl-CoA dehydrogenase [Rhizobium sp.]
MPSYSAPLREYQFLLHHVFRIEGLSQTNHFEHATPDVFDAVLTEAARFCENVLAPINRSGDEQGCHFDNGRVTTPDGFREAYALFRDGGWAGLTADPDHGGQGLPHALQILVDEMITSAKFGFAMYRGLNEGAYRLLLKYGSEHLKETYLAPIASGELLPTMNLTEPHSGSDLGLLRTRAEPDDQGTYRITGNKIFITGGEHDLTDNIPHFVLASLPDAPAGSRGISLFLVPKFYTDEKSGENVRNALSCGAIEHKMGLKASATCVMSYDGARDWLVGASHSGLQAMFTLMNAARLGVGVQGVSAAEGSHQIASAYAAERKQGKAPGIPGDGPDPIDRHPDVRRMLLTQKAFAQGGRALTLRMALAMDTAHAAEDAVERERHEDLVQVMTPIVKAFLTDAGSEAANLGVQIMGGHGYIREWGAEQWVRDIRIATIYEGTNGIQALDLVGRKLTVKNGAALDGYLSLIKTVLIGAETSFPPAADGLKALATLEELTTDLRAADIDARSDAASDFLSLFGLVALSAEWSLIAKTAVTCRYDDPTFHADKLETAHFYMQRILPRYRALEAGIRAALGGT